jgi:hypothetical protein
MTATPLERLDEAIHAYLDETGQAHKAINGWVVGISTSRVEASDTGDVLPLVSGAQYALGPQTSTTDAAGLAQFLSVVMERAHWHMLNAGDEDDDD